LENDKISHTLEHMNIAELVVTATIVENRYSPEALNGFFEALRNGHRPILANHDPALEDVIGLEEVHELDHSGPFGKFVGRMAMTESGLIAVEHSLHGKHDDALESNFANSLRTAAQTFN